MKELNYIYKFIICGVLLGLFALSFFLGRYTKRNTEIVKIDTVKVVRIDTIRLTELKPVKIIVKDTLKVPVTDTLRINDTLFINLPREQKTYKDSTFKAVVSGYKPNLDSIEVYNKTITNTIIKYREKKFGFGVIGGIGVSDKVRPFVGVGAYYKIF